MVDITNRTDEGSKAEHGSTDQQYLYSPAYKVATDVMVGVGAPMTLDGFQRLIYDRISENIQRQANILLVRGNITAQEAAHLINGRNELAIRIRSRLSPFSQFYSEILKPKSSLKSLDQLLKQKGTIEAVLNSVGKTRQVVDKIGVIARVAGPATIILSISCTAIVIAKAPPGQRGRVAAREVGGTAGALLGGIGGMWAGCAAGASLVSPTLVVPIWGPVTAGGACLVGGIVGGLGIGYAGQKVGSEIGAVVYNQVSEFQWVRLGLSRRCSKY